MYSNLLQTSQGLPLKQIKSHTLKRCLNIDVLVYKQRAGATNRSECCL